MESETREKTICEGCGGILPPDSRYCVFCYKPVKGSESSTVHRALAHNSAEMRRKDPTVIFNPVTHEIIEKRHKRRMKIISTSIITLSLSVIVLAASMIIFRRQVENKKSIAREEMAFRELNQIADGLELFKMDIGRYPVASEGIRGLFRRPIPPNPKQKVELDKWIGPYLDGDYEVDPWGNDYVYTVTEGGKAYELLCYGPEGEGTQKPLLRLTSK